jgi:hypothetical protein
VVRFIYAGTPYLNIAIFMEGLHNGGWGQALSASHVPLQKVYIARHQFACAQDDESALRTRLIGIRVVKSLYVRTG